jgi:hypothetical protein
MPEYEVHFQSGKTISISDERTLEKIGNTLIESGRLLAMEDTGMEICLIANSIETIRQAGDDKQTTSGSHRQRPLRVQRTHEQKRKHSRAF